MTRMKIYQMDIKTELGRKFCFMHTRYFEEKGFDLKKLINEFPYKMVWQGTVEADDLEAIFVKFNWGCDDSIPADYKTRSLSVSDVVEIEESDSLDSGKYFCDSIGWKKI